MAEERLGDQPIEPHLHEMMNALAKGLDDVLNAGERPKKNGFVLMVFPFEGFEGRANYISNAHRADVVVLLKEQLARFEGMAGGEGTA
jgi:hypothetical protein